jgi:prepilin-type N-terminal cleavage/methylation domain-containing protein
MRVQSPESRVQSPEKRNDALADFRHSSFVIRRFQEAFTLIELLTVIAIIGILAALLAPVLKNFSKPDVTVAATRQMLDDFGRARQLAISQRATVFMAFVPTNFWAGVNSTAWGNLPFAFQTSTLVTQMYAAQLNGYIMESLRSVGDQPGRIYPRDLVRVKTLPEGAFIADVKFSGPVYNPSSPGLNAAFPTNRSDLQIYRFNFTNTIPFPCADIFTNLLFANNYAITNAHFVNLPFIAFNYLGQLCSADGTLLAYDENIPLSYGILAHAKSLNSKSAIAGPTDAREVPPGNSTNISYNVIHIDRLTGRARLERQDLL